jgi:hypothetical protein
VYVVVELLVFPRGLWALENIRNRLCLVLGFDEVFGLSMTRTEDLFVMVCVGLGCI